jgi:hypothetical protein
VARPKAELGGRGEARSEARGQQERGGETMRRANQGRRRRSSDKQNDYEFSHTTAHHNRAGIGIHL